MAAEDTKYGVIQKNYADTPALDYAFLRREAIDLIQKFSGQNWTDFNIHDPGITILELLCYAITDLAYRTGFPITDLLADANGNIPYEAHSFIPRNRILSSDPVSVTDFRKLLIDKIDGLNNAWLEPVSSSFSSGRIGGAYRVILQADANAQQTTGSDEEKEKEDAIVRQAKSILAEYRNIGEDFIEFIVLQPQKIEVTAEVLISKTAVPEEVLANIYFRLEEALNPHTVFFTEQLLLAQGHKIEDIYKGPLLKHGIIPDCELKELPEEIDKASLAEIISDTDTVSHIRLFRLRSEGEADYTGEPVRLKKYHYPLLSFNRNSPDISLYYNSLKIPVQTAVFNRLLQRRQDMLQKDFIADVHKANILKQEGGTYRNVQEYVSLQNLFPAIYRIGSEGIEDSASPLRKAQAKQLKAYLLFYEQILAGYVAQLGSLDRLFSTDIGSPSSATYFFQPLYAVPGIAPLLAAFNKQQNNLWEAFQHDSGNDYIRRLRKLTESDEIYNTRKKKVFDHLLSRFNVVPDNYPVLLYEQLYRNGRQDERTDDELVWKAALLSRIEVFTGSRVRADNYHSPHPENRQSGFSFNMRMLLYIQDKEARLSDAVTGYMEVNKKRHSGQSSGFYKTEAITYNGETLNVIQREDDTIQSAFHFPHQSARFFEWGVDRSNYKIIPDEESGDQLVLYKNQTEPNWHIVRRYPDYQSAHEGIKSVIEKLTDISIQSEGFQVVEHLQLAPPRDANVFGFILYDGDQPLLRQATWSSAEVRKNVLKKIQTAVATASTNPLNSWLLQLQDLCVIVTQNNRNETVYVQPANLQYEPDEDLQPLLRRIQNSLQEAGDGSGLHFVIRHWDGSEVEEDFYDNRVTIVLPSWPLRFQQDGFRKFTENTFHNNLPLHLNVDFLWLGISKMARFETMFFNWKEALQNENPDARRMESILFIPFLQEELKRRKS